MGVRILQDWEHKHAVLYCSTTDWALGPVVGKKSFGSKDREQPDPSERLEAFLRWLVVDARTLSHAELEEKYTEWLAQEAEQYDRERLKLLERHSKMGLLIRDPASKTDDYKELDALRARFK